MLYRRHLLCYDYTSAHSRKRSESTMLANYAFLSVFVVLGGAAICVTGWRLKPLGYSAWQYCGAARAAVLTAQVPFVVCGALMMYYGFGTSLAAMVAAGRSGVAAWWFVLALICLSPTLPAFAVVL